MTISKDHVFKAADSLSEEGIEPTNSAVRERLGSGSYKTITPFLKEWRQLQEQAADVPASINSAMENTLRHVWAEAKETAKLAFVGEKKMLEAQVSELKDELRLRDELTESLNEQIADLNKTIEAKNKAAEAAKAQANERVAELKEANAATVSDLRAQLTETRAEIKEARAEAKEAAKSERDLNKQLVTLTTQISEATKPKR